MRQRRNYGRYGEDWWHDGDNIWTIRTDSDPQFKTRSRGATNESETPLASW